MQGVSYRFSSPESEHLGRGRQQPNDSHRDTQPQSDRIEETIQRGEHSGIGQNLDKQNRGGQPSNQENGVGDVNGLGRPAILDLVQNLKGQKISNEQITELVNNLTEVAEDKTISLKQDIEITEDIKDLVSAYKSGGTPIIYSYHKYIITINLPLHRYFKKLKQKNRLLSVC